jgi:tetratricopeptide (TPR) repeat protein
VDKPHVPGPSISDIWRVPRSVWRARRALDTGDLRAARGLVAPLLDRFGSVTFIRKIAAEVLYASGDPLSAAALFEQVAKKLPADRAVAVGLVASYAALNRAGDARRCAGLLPRHVDVRLALAWSELVALGGDRERGARLVDELARDGELARSPERVAMHLALAAIAAARAGDREAVRARLSEAERRMPKLRAADRAFLGYLGGVALREAGLTDDARATFALAMDADPGAIGSALARRERANLDSR